MRQARQIPWHRILVAVLLGGLAGWIVKAKIMAFPLGLRNGWSDIPEFILLHGIFGIPMALILALFVGFPLAIMAVRRGWTNFGHVLTGVMVFPILYLLPLLLEEHVEIRVPDIERTVILLIAALAATLVARRVTLGSWLASEHSPRQFN